MCRGSKRARNTDENNLSADDEVLPMNAASRPVPEGWPIEHHGIIGDRRTGAAIAPDGTIDWFCVPDFDGPPVFGTLLQPKTGGYSRLGPADAVEGTQRYQRDTAALSTSWEITHELEVSDVMAGPRMSGRPGRADNG
jgi:GH15 family glucan-1,4-alpha-glucosidase